MRCPKAVLRDTPSVAEAERPVSWPATYEAGRAHWKTLPLSFEEFWVHVRAVGLSDAAPPLHATDLFLCAACVARHPRAYRIIDETYFPALRAQVLRMARSGALVDDILQDMRDRLFVGDLPRIRNYRGTGPLHSWLRTTARNLTLDRLRCEKNQHLLGESVSHLTATPGPTWSRDHGRDDVESCERAFHSAVQALSSEERCLLRDYFGRGQSIDVLGPRYLANRSTIARRIARVLHRIHSLLRRSLGLRYRGTHARELDRLALDVLQSSPTAAALLSEPAEAPRSRCA